MGARRKGRIIAFQVIFSWDLNKTGIENLYNLEWLDTEKDKITEESIVFAKLLIKGTLENVSEIDEKIRQHIDNWDFKRIAKVDLAILRLSTYSLLFQKEIAGNIIIDEAVDISRVFSSDESYRFINGVLDSIYKEMNDK
ncbi:MAG: transcription antitermination factor NusB [Spirochaetales bacterium]|nr:transcription antitermination factor NusB [Spirochaetales bacterium]